MQSTDEWRREIDFESLQSPGESLRDHSCPAWDTPTRSSKCAETGRPTFDDDPGHRPEPLSNPFEKIMKPLDALSAWKSFGVPRHGPRDAD